MSGAARPVNEQMDLLLKGCVDVVRVEDLEREVLALTAEELSAVLRQLPPWPEATTTGAGLLPVPGSPRR